MLTVTTAAAELLCRERAVTGNTDLAVRLTARTPTNPNGASAIDVGFVEEAAPGDERAESSEKIDVFVAPVLAEELNDRILDVRNDDQDGAGSRLVLRRSPRD